MSYDLFFARRAGGELSLEAFESFFRGRPHWKVEGAQAWYGNDDTGVYFSLEWGGSEVEPDADAANPEAGFDQVASFNLNYFRPHYFGLEAAPELAAFVAGLDLLVDDPQMSGMGRGEFSIAGFLAGWNVGNQFGYDAIVSQHGDTATLHAKPTLELESCWRWNQARASLQAEVGESAFVPRIVFMTLGGAVRSGAVWGDAIPAILPAVDVLLIPRKEHAPRRFLMRAQDLACVPWVAAIPTLSGFPARDEPAKHYRLLYENAPAAVSSFVRGLSPTVEKPEILSNDKVLNAELLDDARGRRARS